MLSLTRLLLAICMALAPALGVSDTTAPYSEPYHKQGRGWYPSIYWSTGRNLGSFYFPNTNGELFKELGTYDWDKETHGLIYFYRPDSQWALEELEAPSYYINDEIVFNLRSGSYTYVVLPAGSYDFAVRKSLLPLIGFEAFDDKLMMAFDLNLQANIGLEIDPGSITYIRHSEVSLPAKRHPDLAADDAMATADVQLVDREQAMTEMPKTRFLTHSFWHPTDAQQAEELLSGEMQEYGWFNVIWPWSNNFLWGFPIFYLPSDMYRELKGDDLLTLEEELYQYSDNKEEYLEEIADRREPRRNWLAPWRVPRSGLTLNDELILDRLEREALAGEIKKPASLEDEEVASEESESEPWYEYFRQPQEIGGQDEVAKVRQMGDARKQDYERIKQALN